MISTGLIGFGYWGANLARNLASHTAFTIERIIDKDTTKAKRAAALHVGVQTGTRLEEVLADPRIALVVIATPLESHFQLARSALEARKHILLTKPMVPSIEEADRLCELAAANDLLLMVDHTFSYSEPVRRMREIVEKGLIGEVLYSTSMRVNLGTFRSDANVLWDLAAHDLSILQYLTGKNPVAVVATGGLDMGSGVVQIAHLTAYYLPNTIAHITVSWLSPVKVRLMLIGGTRQMIVYNDLEPDERVKVYDRSVEVAVSASLPTGAASFEGVVQYRMGDMWAPHIGRGEALSAELDHLAWCLESGEEPLTSGRRSRAIVAALVAADRSLASDGTLTVIDSEGWNRWAGRRARSSSDVRR